MDLTEIDLEKPGAQNGVKKLLLIWPPTEFEVTRSFRQDSKIDPPRFPIGIGYLAKFIEQNSNVRVDILDACAVKPVECIEDGTLRYGLSAEEILEFIQSQNYQMVGVSQMFSYQEPSVTKIFDLIKQFDPTILTVWGGTHPTVMPDRCLSHPSTDFIILGEGEKPLLSLLNSLNGNGLLKDVPALGLKDKEGTPTINTKRSWVKNLDAHVTPKRETREFRSHYHHEKYTGFGVAANIVTSRGCPFSCTFCTAEKFYQKTFRVRSPQSVVDEIEYLVQEFDIHSFLFQDENFTYDMPRCIEISNEIVRRNLKIKWFAESGMMASRLSEELIEAMAKSGLTEIKLAVESGDKTTLKTMKKPINLSRVPEVIGTARKHNVRVAAFLILGMPGEDEECMMRTGKFALEMGFDWSHIGAVLPLPGTKIFDDALTNGEVIDFVRMGRYGQTANWSGTELPQKEINRIRSELDYQLNFAQYHPLKEGDVDVAINTYSDLAQRFPQSDRIFHYLGMALYKSGETASAYDAFSTAAKCGSKYNSIDWVEAIRSNISHLDKNALGYLPHDVENRLQYHYGRRFPAQGCDFNSPKRVSQIIARRKSLNRITTGN